MKNPILAVGLLALTVAAVAAAGGSKSPPHGTEPRGTGGAGIPAERKLATDSVGKAVDMPEVINFFTPRELKWVDAPPSLPRGAKLAVLEGDPSLPNKHYTMRLRFPANYRVAPHYHPSDERITILSGSVAVGHGDKWESSRMQTFQPLAFYGFPAGTSHFVQTRSEVVIQVAGVGPFDLIYINPADDPRTGTGGAGTGGTGQDAPPVQPKR